MPLIKTNPRYVIVAYELCCGFERATVLAKALCQALRYDKGLQSADDDSRGWDGERQSLVRVWYRSLADANRLDAKVRCLLADKA